jgi:hypothetical protein
VAVVLDRVFLHLSMGRLERGWRLITQGIVFTSSGFFFVALDHAFPRLSLIYFYIGSVGAVLSLIGIVFMLQGLHSYYVVWYKKPDSSPRRKKAVTTNDLSLPATKVLQKLEHGRSTKVNSILEIYRYLISAYPIFGKVRQGFI